MAFKQVILHRIQHRLSVYRGFARKKPFLVTFNSYLCHKFEKVFQRFVDFKKNIQIFEGFFYIALFSYTVVTDTVVEFAHKDKLIHSKGGKAMSKPSILLVSPNENILDLLMTEIGKEFPSAKITAFGNPMLAVKHGINSSIDILFTEVEMHTLNGFDVVSILRQHTEDMKTVFLCNSDRYKEEAWGAKVDAYVSSHTPAEIGRAVRLIRSIKEQSNA